MFHEGHCACRVGQNHRSFSTGASGLRGALCSATWWNQLGSMTKRGEVGGGLVFDDPRENVREVFVIHFRHQVSCCFPVTHHVDPSEDAKIQFGRLVGVDVSEVMCFERTRCHACGCVDLHVHLERVCS